MGIRAGKMGAVARAGGDARKRSPTRGHRPRAAHGVLIACALLGAAALAAAAPAHAKTVWLCRPGLADNPCTQPLNATSVAADGTRTPLPASPATRAPI